MNANTPLLLISDRDAQDAPWGPIDALERHWHGQGFPGLESTRIDDCLGMDFELGRHAAVLIACNADSERARKTTKRIINLALELELEE